MFERGMPEIVAHYSEHKDLVALNAIYESLLVSYLDDVEKYAQHPSQVDYIRHAIRSSFAEPSLLPGIADRKIPGMDRGADWPIMKAILRESCILYPQTAYMKQLTALLFLIVCVASAPPRKKTVVVWQPSHQTNTGKNFSEAAVCNGITEAAIASTPHMKEYKVWSLGRTDVHNADSGSNTVVAHTSAVVDGKISGYAWEVKQSNKEKPDVFIAVHNNGGTRRHAVWGYIHYGDAHEAENRDLAATLIASIAAATTLENRGVLLDSSTGRNDYRCASTGKLSFYSLDEHVNTAPIRVLLEIGDNGASYDFLRDPANQQKIGEAIKKGLAQWLEKRTPAI
ncbi:MAG: N-acetylmuramoyl-L-alanine amidase [Sediminibacterium sp.]